MRCFFMKRGHIAAVEVLAGLNDEEAIKKARELFETRKHEAGYEGFEVWELSRVVIQYPPTPVGTELEHGH